MTEKALEYSAEHEDRFVSELKELCRLQSVSADPSRKTVVAETAEWLAGHLRSIGMEKAEVHPTSGHPVVYAEKAGPAGSPTVLIYGHYDVQPEDPVDLWKTPPFEPAIRDGVIYGRGVADNKGQLFAHVKALESILATEDRPPVHVKMIFEGEEEIGSPSLKPFLIEHQELLACDVLVVSDTAMFARGMPAITYGLRGLCYMQIDLEAASSDLHSGSWGGAVANPANVLARIIDSMKDENLHIRIPGFYDDVLESGPEEKAALAKLPHDDEAFRKLSGAPALEGEAGYSTLERIWTRPTLDVNGLWSGYQGEGSKTVLPSKAGAKISMRLVPNQDPTKIAMLFEKYVLSFAPQSVRVKVTRFGMGRPFLCPLDNPMLQCAAKALKLAFGKDALFMREGGSIPIVTEFSETLEAPVLLIGFSVPGDNAHAPNESFLLENFFGGIRTSIHLMNELAKRG